MDDKIHPAYSSQFQPVAMEMVESRLRNAAACLHQLGEKHQGFPHEIKNHICAALFTSAYRYLGLASAGMQSWDAEDSDHFYISCPCRTGTVWKIGRSRHE